MASLTEIARPYAKVAFELAVESKRFDAWTGALLFAKTLSRESAFKSVLRHTKRGQLPAMIGKLAEGIASGEELRFVQELIGAGRLEAAEKVYDLFETQKAEKEGFAAVEITSAKPASDEDRKALVSALERQFGRKLRAIYKIDTRIQGGFIARVGDKIYDASVRGALDKMSGILRN